MSSAVRSVFRILIMAALLAAGTALGQISDRVSRVTVGPADPGQPVVFRVELVAPDRLDRVEIAWRQYGQTDYHRTETAITGNVASATIAGSQTSSATALEYYILIYPRGGGKAETYPIENPDQQPFRVSLISESTGPGPITVLSPDENESIPPGEALFSFFVNETDSAAPAPVVKVTLDEVDFTAMAVRTGNLFVVKPENSVGPLSAGAHVIAVTVSDSTGTVKKRITRQFSVSGGVPYAPASKSRRLWSYTASAQLESRHETIADAETPYNRATVAASGTYSDFRMDGKLYVTNEEKSERQPQNRYYLGLESPWLKLTAGDAFPVLSDLIMSGKRVRGFTGSLTLGTFNIDVVQGSIVRHIDTELGPLFTATKEQADSIRTLNPSEQVSLLDSATHQYGVINNPGTFERSIVVVHPIFGIRDGNHLGFTYLKSSDDLASIRYGLDPRYGNAPEENVVLGSDMHLAFDDRNIELNAEAAFSATNKDITSGTFSDADIDRVFPSDSYSDDNRNTIRRIRDIVSNIITVNENLVPLGTRNMPTLAYDGSLALNYFNNYLKVAYLRHGESYESFGESFVRTDVAGYNISDRLRLVQNQLFLSGGYERLQDNTAQTKAFTTTANTANVSVSYYPLSQFPSVTVGVLSSINDNQDENPDSLSLVNDRTARVFVSLGKDFEYGVHHQAMLNVSTSSRDDQTYRDLDTRTTTVSLGLTSYFTGSLQTSFGCVINSSRIPQIDSLGGTQLTTLSYTTLTAGAQYRLVEDKLRISGSVSPTFGDFRRVLVDGNVQYYFLPQVSLQTQISLYLNRSTYGQSGSTNDIIWGLILRADV
jgi:hypothetical protein